MQKLKEVMTTDVEVISPNATLREVADKMKSIDAGAIPVCDKDRLVGIITDRDIVLRALASGNDLNKMYAHDVMTSPIVYCFEDEDVSEAAHIMEEKQIRRLVVLNQNKRLVGIVSLGDIAVKSGSDQLSGQVLEKVSEPVRGKAA